MRVTVISILNGALGTVLKGFEKKTEGIGNQKKNQVSPNHRTVMISVNTKMSPRNFRRLSVTQNSVKDFQVNLGGKNELISTGK